MGNPNGIFWNPLQHQGDRSTSLLMQAYGNISNGAQALNANLDKGVDRLIDRYDTIDQKNRSYNTQLLLNKLNQADTPEKQAMLANAGYKDLASVKQMLGGGEFDEKAYNTALAQWDAGVNNRAASQDALKIYSPEGRAAYINGNLGIAYGDQNAVGSAIANPNLRLGDVAGMSSAGSKIGERDWSKQVYADNENTNRAMINNSNSQAAKLVANDTLLNMSRALNITGTASGKVLGNMGIDLANEGFSDPTSLFRGLNSKDAAAREHSETALKKILPTLSTTLSTPPEDIDAAIRSGKVTINQILQMASEKIVSGGVSAFDRQPNSNIRFGSSAYDAPTEQASVPQSPTNTSDNVLVNAAKKYVPDLNDKQGRAELLKSITEPASATPLGNPRSSMIGGEVANTDLNTLAAYADLTGDNSLISNLTPDKAGDIDKKSPAYNTALNFLKKNYSADSLAKFKEDVQTTNKDLSSATDAIFNADHKIKTQNGETVPMSEILKPMDKEKSESVSGIRENIGKGNTNEALTKIKNTFFKDENEFGDYFGIGYKDKAAKLLYDAYEKTNNPKVFDMAANIQDYLKGKAKNQKFVSTGFNSKESDTALGMFSQLANMDENTTKEYENTYKNYSRAKNSISPEALAYALNNNRPITSILPNHKNFIDYGKELEDSELSPLAHKFGFIKKVSGGIDKLDEITARLSSARGGLYRGGISITIPNKDKDNIESVNVSKQEYNEFVKLAETNPEAKALLAKMNKANDLGYIKLNVK